MQNQKLTNILSIACKAGKILSGEFVIEQSLGKKKIYLLILAKDISESSKNQYLNWSIKYNIKILDTDVDKNGLGACIGKSTRVAIAILDEGFANKIAEILDN